MAFYSNHTPLQVNHVFSLKYTGIVSYKKHRRAEVAHCYIFFIFIRQNLTIRRKERIYNGHIDQ